jgi:hypothetical protein
MPSSPLTSAPPLPIAPGKPYLGADLVERPAWPPPR